MWYNGTSAGGNYALGYAAITTLTPPGPGVSVGGDVGQINKMAVIAPYLGLFGVLVAVIFIGRRLVRVH
jgi:uncharacterized membrane protein YozB (DUF420 family)